MSENSVKNTKNDTARYRNFATVVYPESAPADWLTTLGEQCIPCYVSPLHDKDVNPTGEPKKAHYHVLFTFDGKKSKEQIKSVVDLIKGVGVEIVQSQRGYARYLCHLDNPEKHQYNTEEVRCFGGADYPTAIGLPTDKYKIIKEMMEFCVSCKIYAYAELLEFAAENKMDWFRVLCDSGTVVMREYLKSRKWQFDNKASIKMWRSYGPTEGVEEGADE